MAGKAHAVRDFDGAYPELLAGSKGVHVKALADADIALRRGDQARRSGEILRGRNFQIVFAALDDQRDQARGLGHGGIVGQFTADGGAVGGEDRIEMKALRGLGAPQRRAINRLPNGSALGALDRVAQGQARDYRDRLIQSIDDPVDEAPIRKRPRPIMDEHAARPEGPQSFHPAPTTTLARRATRYR